MSLNWERSRFERWYKDEYGGIEYDLRHKSSTNQDYAVPHVEKLYACWQAALRYHDAHD